MSGGHVDGVREPGVGALVPHLDAGLHIERRAGADIPQLHGEAAETRTLSGGLVGHRLGDDRRPHGIPLPAMSPGGRYSRRRRRASRLPGVGAGVQGDDGGHGGRTRHGAVQPPGLPRGEDEQGGPGRAHDARDEGCHGSSAHTPTRRPHGAAFGLGGIGSGNGSRGSAIGAVPRAYAAQRERDECSDRRPIRGCSSPAAERPPGHGMSGVPTRLGGATLTAPARNSMLAGRRARRRAREGQHVRADDYLATRGRGPSQDGTGGR